MGRSAQWRVFRDVPGPGAKKRAPGVRAPASPTTALLDRAVDRAELGRDAGAQGPDGDDGDDGDEGEQEAVLDHARAALVLGELGLDPGLQNEEVHCDRSLPAPCVRL